MKRMLQRPQYIPPVHRVQLRTISRQSRVIREQAALIRRLGEKASGKINEGEKRQQPGGQAAIEAAESAPTSKNHKFILLFVTPAVLLAIVALGAYGAYDPSFLAYEYSPMMRMRKNEAAEKAAIEREAARVIPQVEAIIEARVQAELKAREQRKREFEAAFTRPSGSCCGGAQR